MSDIAPLELGFFGMGYLLLTCRSSGAGNISISRDGIYI